MSAALHTHLHPFRSHWLDLDGWRYHYLDEGPREAPVVLMLHGNPTWCFHFRRLLAPLSERYRVVVPDHLGCGLSDKPQRYPYTLAHHAANLQRLIDALELRDVVLAMHDWGGAIGFGCAMREPARFRALVLFNTAAFLLPSCPLRIRMCRVPGLGALLVRGLNAFARAALWFATSKPERFPAEVRRAYLAPYDSWANRIALHRFVLDIPLEPDHPTRSLICEIEKSLAAFRERRTLILWGADDFCFTRVFLNRWRELLPRSEVHLLEGAGHYVVEDAHDEVLARLTGFLARLD